MLRCLLQSCFHIPVAPNGGFSVQPGTCGHWVVFAPETVLFARALPVVGGQQMGKVRAVDVTPLVACSSRG